MKIENNPKRFFTLIFIYNIAVVLIVIQVLSWTLYFNFQKAGNDLINTLAKKNLSFAVDNIQKDFDTIMKYSQQIFVAKDIINFMYGNNLDQEQLNEITYRLTAYSAVSSYIYSVYVYNRKLDYFYCSDQNYSDYSGSFYDKEINSIIKEAKITDFTPVIRRIPDRSNPQNSIDVYSFILYDNYGNKKQSDAALVVNVKSEPFIKMLESTKYIDDSSYLVLSPDGMVTCSSNGDTLLSNVKGTEYIKNVMKDLTGSGSYVSTIDHSDFQISYMYSPKLRWTFVNITPYNNLYTKIEKIKMITLYISLLVLISAISISFLLSRNISNPIKTLLNKVMSLDKIKKDNFTALRRDILANLIYKGVSSKNTAGSFTDFNIKLDLEKDFLLVHARIDNTARFYETFDIKDRQLMLFSVGNITNEMLQESFIAESVESDKDFCDIIINIEKKVSNEVFNLLKESLVKAQEEIFKIIKFTVSFSISRPINDLQQIYDNYSTLLETSNYRFIKGHSSIIDYSEIKIPSESLSYPFNIEKQMFELLLLGKFQEAWMLYNDMIQLALKYSYNDIMQFFTQLSLSINSFINKLNSTANAVIDFEFYRFCLFLNKAETITEVNKKFELLFKEICDALAPDKEDKTMDLINKINAYLEKNSYDPNLTINAVADYFDKSAKYLGRLYKKLTGDTIPDYINELRLKKAMYLLSNSPLKIDEICKNIGFINENYFYMFFRKHTGITPNEYRNRNS